MESQPPLPRLDREGTRTVTKRAVGLGLAGVVLICALTPYNDYALNNSPLVGNNLPVSALMLLCFTVLLNSLVRRYAPARALMPAEIAVALAMILVGCALPSAGLMRYFPPSLVTPFWHAGGNRDYYDLLQKLNLPSWLFPAFEGNTLADRIRDPLVTGYLGRWSDETRSPYAAWLLPMFTWGIFFTGLFGALISLTVIIRRQWNENERLAFPLAQIQLALLEQPEPGKALNRTLGKQSFWIAFCMIFFLHVWNGCAQSWPSYFPEIPLKFDFSTLMTEPPFNYTETGFQSAPIYFSIVGAMYFVSSSVAFSLWFFFVALQVYRMAQGLATGDSSLPGEADQHFGAIIAFALMIVWVGRQHWAVVIRQAFRGERKDEPRGRYLSYRVAFWGLVGGFALMVGWLVAAGSGIFAAIITITLLLTLFVAIARIVGETGLVYAGLSAPLQKPFMYAVAAGWTKPVSVDSFYLTGMLDLHHYDFREPLSVFSTHALKITDEAVFDNNDNLRDFKKERRTGVTIVLCLLLALVVGYFVSYGSTLWTEYTYAVTKDMSAVSPINSWAAGDEPRWWLLDRTVRYTAGPTNSQYSPFPHVIGGFAITSFLSFMRITFSWWPLHPVGFVLMATTPVNRIWFATFVGWLTKTLLVRFGGSKLYADAKPFFVGLIVGEAMAAGVWMIAGIVFSALDIPYRPVLIMPT